PGLMIGARPDSSQSSASADWDVVPVFYGTDRARKDQPKRITFASERARRLEVGLARVTIPKPHQVGGIERPFAVRVPFQQVTIYEAFADPKQHFTIQRIEALSAEQFLARGREGTSSSRTYP